MADKEEFNLEMQVNVPIKDRLRPAVFRFGVGRPPAPTGPPPPRQGKDG